MMMQLAPIAIGPLSAVSTAPKPIEQLGPIVTSPHTTALGAIRLVAWILGCLPSWRYSMAILFRWIGCLAIRSTHPGDARGLFPEPPRCRVVPCLRRRATRLASVVIAAGLAFDFGRACEIDRRLRPALGRDRQQLLGDPGADADQPRIVVAEPAVDEPGMQAIGGDPGAGKPARELAREQDVAQLGARVRPQAAVSTRALQVA